MKVLAKRNGSTETEHEERKETGNRVGKSGQRDLSLLLRNEKLRNVVRPP